MPINRLMAMLDQRRNLASGKQHVLVPRSDDGFEVQNKRPFELLSTRVDLAFTSCGDRTGCDDMHERYRFVDVSETQWEQAKFVLDIESYSESTTSFRQLLLSGSLVLRSSLFQDFWVSQAKPWVRRSPPVDRGGQLTDEDSRCIISQYNQTLVTCQQFCYFSRRTITLQSVSPPLDKSSRGSALDGPGLKQVCWLS